MSSSILTRKLFFCCILLGSSTAFACDNPVTLANEQVRAYRDVLENPDADELDLMDAIEFLMCDSREFVQSIAIDAGLKSDSRPVRAFLLKEILFQKNSIVIRFTPDERLNDKAKEWLSNNPSLLYEFSFKDRQNSCIGLYNGRSCDEYFVDISGETITVQYHRNNGFGQFRLTEDGKLEGEYQPFEIKINLPAEIDLY